MSLQLNNSNYATTATSPVANYGASGLTIMAWGMMDSGTTALDYLVHIGQDDSTNLNSAALRKSTASAAEATAFDGTTSSSSTTTATGADANWHHYAAVFASASSRIAYHDGTAATESTVTRTLGADFDILRIGATCAAANNWNGKIAHVAVWSKALSGAQISSLAGGSNPLTIESGSLVAYWPLTTNDANFLVDTVASLTLTGTGSPTYSSTNPTVDAATTTYVKLVAPSDAEGETVEGVVLNSTRDTVIGEFTGQTFVAGTGDDAGFAVLKIDVSDITPDGSTLTTSDTPLISAKNATYGTVGLPSATVIEE